MLNLDIESRIRFFEQGGPVFSIVLLTSFLLWIMILERYWYFHFIFPEKLQDTVREWKNRDDHSSWYALRIREGLLADIAITLQKSLIPIQAMTAILPLLGLLGTVTGMIAIFDVMQVFSTGNTRGMASGISRALLPTIAGLVTALAGLYFSSDLERQVRTRAEQAKDLLQF